MAKKNRKRIKVDEAEIPMSSMIDVVFLLLIYFIVTQKPIVEETLLSCDLPTPGGPPPDKPPTLMKIGVFKILDLPPDKDINTYFLNGSPWPLDSPSAPNDLRRQLKAMAATDPDQPIIINCGPNAYHQKLVQLLDACSDAGLTKLNIADDEGIKFNGK